MTPWDELTEAGKLRRLRNVAWSALAHYPFEASRLRLVGGFTNAVFRADTDRGVFAVRVDSHQDLSEQDTDGELAWLAAIAAETDLDVVRRFSASDGRSYVYAAAPGVPGARRCTVFEWVPGRPLAERNSPEGYAWLGRLSAGLHRHGAAYVPPHRPMAWDRVFYWPASVEPVVIDLPEHQRIFSGNRRSTFDRAMERVTGAFQRLDHDRLQVLHGDLHPWNVHVYRTRLIASDFEDIMWGHPVQDVAITLFYQRNEPDYPAFRSVFEDGYRSVAPWPVSYPGELEHFMAARTLMFINYVTRLHEDPSEFHDAMFTRLERFLADWD